MKRVSFIFAQVPCFLQTNVSERCGSEGSIKAATAEKSAKKSLKPSGSAKGVTSFIPNWKSTARISKGSHVTCDMMPKQQLCKPSSWNGSTRRASIESQSFEEGSNIWRLSSDFRPIATFFKRLGSNWCASGRSIPTARFAQLLLWHHITSHMWSLRYPCCRFPVWNEGSDTFRRPTRFQRLLCWFLCRSSFDRPLRTTSLR